MNRAATHDNPRDAEAVGAAHARAAWADKGRAIIVLGATYQKAVQRL